VNGYNGGEYSKAKKDHIANWLNKNETTTVFLAQETWDKDDTTTEIEGVLFLSNGATCKNNNRRHGGCGIVLSKKAAAGWKLAGQPDPIKPGLIANSIRNIGVEIHLPDKRGKILKFLFISTYLPHSGNKYTQKDYNDTLQQIQIIIDKCPKDAILIIGGDFNASIGLDHNQDNQPVTGKYGNEETSTNGKQLIEFMTINNLISTATFFQKENHNTWSWQGNGLKELQIDHILIKRNDLRRFLDVQTCSGVLSDHKALTATLRIAKHIPKKTDKKKEKRNNEETERKPIKRKKIDWSLIPHEKNYSMRH
jgi:Endonuclease-reverse transcriptase